MKNPATNPSQEDFNEFTMRLFLKLVKANPEHPRVVLRNGRIVELSWVEDGDDQYFATYIDEEMYIWTNSGHSIYSRMLDMMETVE